jgi:HlyD family secretion protein
MIKQKKKNSLNDEIYSDSELGILMKKICPPLNWLVLTIFCMIFAALLYWIIFGKIKLKTEGLGIIIKGHAISAVQPYSTGRIRVICAFQGEFVRKGQILAWIEQPQLFAELTAQKDKIKVLKENLKQLKEINSKILNIREKETQSKKEHYSQDISFLNSNDAWYKVMLVKFRKLLLDGAISDMAFHYFDTDFTANRVLLNDYKQKLQILPLNNIKENEILIKEEIKEEIRVREAEEQLDSLEKKYELYTKITSPLSGIVVEVVEAEGSIVTPSSNLFTINAEEKGDILNAIIYFSPLEGKKVEPGMPIYLDPTIYKKEKYGFIKGIVVSVSDYPVTEGKMFHTLGNIKMVKMFSKSGPPIVARVQLTPDKNNRCGYKWTSSKGPPEKLQMGLVCSAEATTRIETPLSLCLEAFRKYTLGDTSTHF